MSFRGNTQLLFMLDEAGETVREWVRSNDYTLKLLLRTGYLLTIAVSPFPCGRVNLILAWVAALTTWARLHYIHTTNAVKYQA